MAGRSSRRLLQWCDRRKLERVVMERSAMMLPLQLPLKR
jgi:hypothetical protein